MLLTKKEVAERLGVSESTVYRLFKTRQLGGYQIASVMRFEESDVEAFLARAHSAPVEPRPTPVIRQPEQPAPLLPVPQKKRGRGRPRKGVVEVPEYYPGMKVV